ncbi:hypothetical protein BJY04DRAFT_213545 [Aspergillus karnatakaensis]|uniref:uncharacterized protein n=1 Tax=Aspergillus karnatakaensis TaxID=1810916 RepID=UPI003CCD214A
MRNFSRVFAEESAAARERSPASPEDIQGVNYSSRTGFTPRNGERLFTSAAAGSSSSGSTERPAPLNIRKDVRPSSSLKQTSDATRELRERLQGLKIPTRDSSSSEEERLPPSPASPFFGEECFAQRVRVVVPTKGVKEINVKVKLGERILKSSERARRARRPSMESDSEAESRERGRVRRARRPSVESDAEIDSSDQFRRARRLSIESDTGVESNGKHCPDSSPSGWSGLHVPLADLDLVNQVAMSASVAQRRRRRN